MEIKRKDLSLKEMLATRNYGIRPLEADQIPSLIGQGLEAIWICKKGKERSQAGAFTASNLGYPSIYVLGGFEAISELSIEEKKTFFELATLAPNLFILLDDIEREEHEDDIWSIKRKEGKLVVSPRPEPILENYLK